MRKFTGVAVFAAGLTMTMTPLVVAAEPADDDSSRQRTATPADNERAAPCVSRREFRRIEARGKNATKPRQVRRIVGSNGERVNLSRAVGSKWAIRMYLHCNSQIRHVYINYRDDRAYRKAW